MRGVSWANPARAVAKDQKAMPEAKMTLETPEFSSKALLFCLILLPSSS